MTIPVSGAAADVRLSIASNTGAPAGQVAEFQVIGTPAPNPDLTVTGMSFSPSAPGGDRAPSRSPPPCATPGPAASGATNVNFYLGTTRVGTASVGGLAAGASTTVSASIGTRDAGSYPLSAKVDESNTVVEQNDTNNSYTNPSPLVVSPVASSDLVASSVAWSPGNPSAGNTVTFSVSIKNPGTVASASGAHGITLTVLNESGTVVKYPDRLVLRRDRRRRHRRPDQPGHLDRRERQVHRPGGARRRRATSCRSSRPTTPVTARSSSVAAPTCRTTCTRPRTARSAAAPASSGRTGRSATWPARRPVGEAVTLNSTGSYVEFTTRASTNTLVTRFSIPDAPGGGGINSTLNVYVNGTFHKAIDLTSQYAWLYGNETSPGNSPSAGGPRHIYDEANVMLNSTVPAGSKIRLQKDPANTTTYAIDFINTEQVAPIANPDPARYTTPTGFTHQDVQNALDRARHGHHRQPGRRLPAGRQLPDLVEVPGVRQGGQGDRRRPLVHPVQRPVGPGQHRRRLPGRELGGELVVRELRLLRQLHLADRRPGQGVRLLQRRRTS